MCVIYTIYNISDDYLILEIFLNFERNFDNNAFVIPLIFRLNHKLNIRISNCLNLVSFKNKLY